MRRSKIFARILLGISILSACSIVEPIETQAASQMTGIENRRISAAEKRARVLQEKKEVEQMVKIALNCEVLPSLDDTVDAMAIAICHTRGINCDRKLLNV